MFRKYRQFILFLIVFLLSIYPISDTDFGWHLATGEYIFQNKTVPKTDIFSFSLPEFPYVYYSWAGELLLYISQKFIGSFGPSILFAVTLTISIYFIYKSSKFFAAYQYLPLFVAAAPVAHILSGGRMRVFGMLFFSIVYFLLNKYFVDRKTEFLILLPVIFLLWSNFHASFILGIGVFSLLLLLKFSRRLLTTFIFSIVAIFINPYFYRIWQQALTITANEVGRLKTVNPDWQSPLAYGLSGYIYLLVFIMLLFFVFKSKVSVVTKVLNFVIFLLSLVTQRFLFALLVVFLPVASLMLLAFIKKFKKQLNTSVVKISLFSLYLVLALLIFQNILKTIYAHSSFASYTNYLATMSPNKNLYSSLSPNATSYLLKNYSRRNILTDANWGGLLLLTNKNLKLFYYGAMDNFNVNGQLFPFVYLDLINSKANWQNTLKVYKVDVIYLPNSYPLIESLKYDPDYNLVFADSKSSIFLKN